jgi:hypothetical protein
MNLRSLPRAAVGGYIKAVRWPLDRATSLLGHGSGNGTSRAEAAVDRADAAAREVAGTALGDDTLKAEGARRRGAVDERERAVALREQAEAKAQAAEQTYEQRTAQAEQRRHAAERQAEARRAKAERTKAERKTGAAKTERARKASAAEAEAKRQEGIDAKARRDRLAVLDERAEALDQREEALTAADEAKRLRSAASRTKAARKA